MGANFSVKANAQRRVKTPHITFPKDQCMAMENPDASGEPSKTQRIIVFYSEDEWEIYLNASKESDKLVVIHFTITSCEPCRWMEPTFEEYADKFEDVDFITINVDELPNAAVYLEPTEFPIHSMPTFLLMKYGDVVDIVLRIEDLHEKIEWYRN